MTKIEILKKRSPFLTMTVANQEVLMAMDEFSMQECIKFGEFLSHNFSTTNHAEEWRCDNTDEIYGIDELYAKYVQYTQAGRV